MSLREHPFVPSSRRLPRSLPGTGHMAQLCLVNEASLIRIRTLINLPAELSGSSRRLTSLILPIQNGRTNGPGSPATVYPPTIPRTGTEGGRGRSLWENDDQAVHTTDLHSLLQALPARRAEQ